METFTMIWTTVSVGIAPLLQWIKGKIPADVPALSFVLAIVFNGISIYAITLAMKLPWDLSVYWPYISDATLVSLGVHVLAKTGDKNGVSVPLMTNKNNHITP